MSPEADKQSSNHHCGWGTWYWVFAGDIDGVTKFSTQPWGFLPTEYGSRVQV